MVVLANPERYGRCNTAIAEAVYACPRYRSVYGTISVTLTRWNFTACDPA